MLSLILLIQNIYIYVNLTRKIQRYLLYEFKLILIMYDIVSNYFRKDQTYILFIKCLLWKRTILGMEDGSVSTIDKLLPSEG